MKKRRHLKLIDSIISRLNYPYLFVPNLTNEIRYEKLRTQYVYDTSYINPIDFAGQESVVLFPTIVFNLFDWKQKRKELDKL